MGPAATYGPLARARALHRVDRKARVDGVVTPLGEPQQFEAVPLGTASLPPADRAALLLSKSEDGPTAACRARSRQGAPGEAQARIDHLKKALADAPSADPKLTASTPRPRAAPQGHPDGAQRRYRP